MAAIVFGFMLFNKREHISETSRKMGDAIVSSTKKMNPGASISSDALAVNKTAEEIDSAMGQFNKAVSQTLSQRDEMADTYADSATLLGLAPEGKDSVSKQDLIDEKVSLKDVSSGIQSKFVRDAAFVSGLHELANIYNETLSDSVIANDDALIGIYNDYIEMTAANEKLNQSYHDGLANIYKSMGIQAKEFGKNGEINAFDVNQAAAMAYIAQAQTNANDLKMALDQLEAIKKNASGQEGDAVHAVTKLKELQADYDALKKENLRLRKIIDPNDTGEGILSIERAVADFPFLRKIQGKVVFVNPEMGFVILDLGPTTRIMMEENGKLQEVEATVPSDGIMTAATSLSEDGQYTGRVQIVEIGENQTIANILSNSNIPNVGDVVFFSEIDLENMKQIRYAKIAKAAAERATQVDETQEYEDDENAIIGEEELE